MDFKFPRMIYKSGTTVDIDGSLFDYKIVESSNDFDALRKDGWCIDTDAAKNKKQKKVEQA